MTVLPSRFIQKHWNLPTKLYGVVFQKTVLDIHCYGFSVYQFSLKKSKMKMNKCLGASLFTDMPPLF
jgi:hypothetical protein